MPLLNYTTTVDATKSIGEIQALLVRAGSKSISLSYGEQQRVDAICFVIPTAFGDRGFRLPARVVAVEHTLKAQCRARKLQPRFATREQSERVAWRIVKDWVEAQLAIIETGMVSIDEVFLPYMLTNRNKTAFEEYAAQHALPAPETHNESA